MCMLTASYPTRSLQVWEKKLGTLLVSELLLTNVGSGNKDGFGLGTTDGNYMKWEASANDVVFTNDYNNIIKTLIDSPFIAHVRAISTGVGAKEGAHPFKANNILLAHNGTFTNYRKFLSKYNKQINDNNPVDSHVITYMLADTIGSGALKPQHLATTLKVVEGSFALLITDATNNNMWVVTGSNPLYVQRSGPLWLINTSKLNLGNVSNNMFGVANLLYSKEWASGEVERIEEYTINLLTTKGLVKVEDLEKPKQVTIYTQYYRGGGSYRNTTKMVSSEDARTRAEWADVIVNLPGMSRLELTLGCFVLLETEWWKVEMDCLEVLYATFKQICEDFGSPAKTEIWKALMSMTKQNAYSVIAAYTDIAFPYMLNSIETLRGFMTEIMQDLKDNNDLPWVGGAQC